jgi:hypothetical protein
LDPGLRRQYSDYARTGQSRKHSSIFLLSIAPNWPWDTSFYSVGTGSSFPGLQRPGREADHLPVASLEVTNEWQFTITLKLICTNFQSFLNVDSGGLHRITSLKRWKREFASSSRHGWVSEVFVLPVTLQSMKCTTTCIDTELGSLYKLRPTVYTAEEEFLCSLHTHL